MNEKYFFEIYLFNTTYSKALSTPSLENMLLHYNYRKSSIKPPGLI